MRFIDGTRVKEFFTCPRLPFLAFHRSRTDELPPTPRSLVYFEAGHRIEKSILDTIEHEAIRFPPGDWNEGFLATQDAMARKVPAIAQGVIKLGEFLGRPDLLLYDRELDGYEVADIKSTMKTKTSARMQIAFYSRLLAQFATPPRRGHVILRDGSRDSFDLSIVDASLKRVLEILQRQRATKNADPGANWREHCLDCRYREICSFDLSTNDAIERLPGITRAQAAALRAEGFSTLVDLGAERRSPPSESIPPTRFDGLHVLPPESFDHSEQSTDGGVVSELPADQIRALSYRARAASDGRVHVFRKARPELESATFALVAAYSERLIEPAVAIAGVVFSDLDRYKLRLLRTADDPQAATNLDALVRNLARSQGPIVVYGDTVKKALDAALHRHRITFDLASLEARFVDLRGEMRRSLALPSFDGTPLLAAQAFSIDVGDDAPDVRALAFLEGAPGAEVSALDDFLRKELTILHALRTRVLTGEVG